VELRPTPLLSQAKFHLANPDSTNAAGMLPRSVALLAKSQLGTDHQSGRGTALLVWCEQKCVDRRGVTVSIIRVQWVVGVGVR